MTGAASTNPRVAFLRDLQAGLVRTEVVSVRIGRPPAGYQVGHADWLYFKIAAPTERVYVRGQWQGQLILGLTRDTAAHRGWRPIAGRTFTSIDANGNEQFRNSSVIENPSPTVVGASEEHLRTLIGAQARRRSIRLTEIRFDRLSSHVAAELTIITAHPEQFVHGAELAQVAGVLSTVDGSGSGHPRLEGALIQVQTESGRWVILTGQSFRTASTVSIINPLYR